MHSYSSTNRTFLLATLISLFCVLCLVFLTLVPFAPIEVNASNEINTKVDKLLADPGAILSPSMIVKLTNDSSDAESVVRPIIASSMRIFSDAEVETRINQVESDEVLVSYDSLNQLETGLRLANAEEVVEYAQPIYKYKTFATPYQPTNDAYFVSQQWYLKDAVNGTRMPSAWGLLGEAKGVNCNSDPRCGGLDTVRVAVIDSGVNIQNDDLPASQIDSTKSARFFYNPENSCNPNEFYESIPIGSASSSTPINFCRQLGVHPDDEGHGTSVTSVIAMKDNATGGVGVAYNTKVVPIALNGDFTFNSYIVRESIEWAVSQGVQVINLSLGTSADDQFLRDSIIDAVNAGVTIVASSGNCGQKTSFSCGTGSNNTTVNPIIYPAAYPEVISVGSVNSGDTNANIRRSNYSSFGNHMDVVVPVGDATNNPWGVLGVSDIGTFSNSYTGTSYAAPQVSALAALAYSLSPSMNFYRVHEALTATSVKVGGATGFSNEYGHGMVNAEAFLGFIRSRYIDWQPVNNDGAGVGKPNLALFKTSLVQAIRGTDNGIYTRSTTGGNWSGWSGSGGTLSNITQTVFNNQLFQSLRGTDNCLYTRSTSDGVNWTPFVCNGGTSDDVAMIVLGGRLIQSIRGTDNGIYTRSTLDGVTWTGWEYSGKTLVTPAFAQLNSRLIQAIRGTDNGIYTRSTLDGVTWTGWIYSGATLEPISMVILNNNRIIQSVRGTDSGIYTRSSTDGLNWTGFVPSGSTLDEITLFNYNNKILQSVRGTDNGIYTRSSTDGLNWTAYLWSGSTKDNIVFQTNNSRLFQSIIGSDGYLYTRFSDNSTDWSPYVADVANATLPTMISFGGKLYQSLFSTNSRVFTRSTF